MDKTDIAVLKAELKNYGGADRFYRNPLFRGYVYTEGVKYLAEMTEAYWLIDYILSNQIDLKLIMQPFQVWKMVVQDDSAAITVEDGNDNEIASFTIGYTDFPLEEIILWVVDKTLLLPSEY
jgi:hypothetical protein